MNDRRALLVACAQYDDPTLDDLRSPVHDIEALAAVLGDDAIGGFAVQTLIDRTDGDTRREVGRFLRRAPSLSVLLLYFACHGRTDLAGRLFLTSVDTDADEMAVTALSADLLRTLIDDSPARTVVLMLDCCFSGAVSRAAVRAGDVVDLTRALPLETGRHRNRIVITATNAVEYSWEPTGESRPLSDNSRHTVFARALITGLRTGDADLDRDGRVSVDDLYRYLFERVRDSGSPQTPGRFGDQYGAVYLARSPSTRPADSAALPSDATGGPAHGTIAEPWSALLPWRASALDWRFGTDQVTPYVSAVARRAWQSLNAGFYAEADRLFQDLVRSNRNDWSGWWGGGLCRAIQGDWAGAGRHFGTAADVADSAALSAGAGVLAVVALAEDADASVAEVLSTAYQRTPWCPHLKAMLAIEQNDDELLGEVFLLMPELAADLAHTRIAAAALSRATRFAQARSARLERAGQRLSRLARMMEMTEVDDYGASGTDHGRARADLSVWVWHAQSLRPGIARLAATLTTGIDEFLQRSTDFARLDLAVQAREAVAYANAALAQTDHPAAVRPLGIPPRRVGN